MLWTVSRLLSWTADYFKKKDIPSARLDAEVLLAHILEFSRVQLYTHFDQPLSADELSQYRLWIARRANREPVAHIIGHKEFYALDFLVGPKVLIPRPDTECLVEAAVKLLGTTRSRQKKMLPWTTSPSPGPNSPTLELSQAPDRPTTDIIPSNPNRPENSTLPNEQISQVPLLPSEMASEDDHPDLASQLPPPLPVIHLDMDGRGEVIDTGDSIEMDPPPVSPVPSSPHDEKSVPAPTDPPLILDLCTGSGIIPICLALECGARAIGVDISPDAVHYARQNVAHHDLDDRVAILQGDLCVPIPRRFHGRFALLTANPPYLTSREVAKLEPEIAKHEPREALVDQEGGLGFYRRIIREVPGMLEPGGWVLFEIGQREQARQVCRLLEDAGLVEIKIFKDLARLERVVQAQRP